VNIRVVYLVFAACAIPASAAVLSTIPDRLPASTMSLLLPSAVPDKLPNAELAFADEHPAGKADSVVVSPSTKSPSPDPLHAPVFLLSAAIPVAGTNPGIADAGLVTLAGVALLAAGIPSGRRRRRSIAGLR
jgi:hypothetical protein